MQGYDSKDLARAFRTVRQNTIQTAEEIPEDKYDFRPAEGSRTVAETLSHLAVMTVWPIKAHTDRKSHLAFEDFQTAMAELGKQQAELTTKPKLLAALRKNGDDFAAFLEKLPDSVLEEKVSFPPEAQTDPKTRFEMLLSTKEHEMHHRAQLMVVERMLGITPHLTRRFQERMAAAQQQAAGSRA
jgi:uncharacterized damage-inducible protein DinB